MGLGDPKTFVYQVTFDKQDTDNTHMIKYVFMEGLVICIKLNSYVAHIFYAWLFIHNASVPILIKHKNIIFLYIKDPLCLLGVI